MLRICAAANEAPYSQSNGTGFENRIADVVAKTMGRKADFVWSERPAIYLVRDQLDPKNCDVVIGVDFERSARADDEALLPRALCFRRARGLASRHHELGQPGHQRNRQDRLLRRERRPRR